MMKKGLGHLMKQAQKMQEQMAKTQEELGSKTVEASAGGGMVTVTANGKQQILSILQEIPADYLRANPERALRMAVLEYRERNGTPIFAQQPGTSGSPSVRAAMAAEAAAPGLNPLDGSGTPRPRQGGPETPADRIRRENREATVTLTSETGRRLGFSA